MARSFSNIRTKMYFDVSLMPAFPDGSTPSVSITPPRFPAEKIIEFVRSDDQQVIRLEDLVEEFIGVTLYDRDDKLGLAEHLELLASRIRDSI
jgi:hypothetical protein